jgi:hypothetical protein
VPVSEFTPSVTDVGALARARTVDAQGRELGTFTPDTRPTASEVGTMISEAVNEASVVIGNTIPDAPGDPTAVGYDKDALRKAALRIVALRAAALVELSYFPEQVARGASPYAQYQESFNQGLARLQNAIEAAEGGEQPGDAGGGAGGTMRALGSFPEDAGGMIGWGTRF